jgi:hypothetical protein
VWHIGMCHRGDRTTRVHCHFRKRIDAIYLD